MRRLFRAMLMTVVVAALAAPAAHAFDPAKSKITVQGSGQVEIYVNGQYMGRSADATRLAAYARALVIGDNAIALRATKGASKKPFAVADLNGAFGRTGSGVLWRAIVQAPQEFQEHGHRQGIRRPGAGCAAHGDPARRRCAAS